MTSIIRKKKTTGKASFRHYSHFHLQPHVVTAVIHEVLACARAVPKEKQYLHPEESIQHLIAFLLIWCCEQYYWL